MFRPMMLALGLALATPAFAQPALADTTTCHIVYGGEDFTVSARPGADPYTVRGEKIGRYFEFRISYVTEPADLAALSIYVYATASGESVLVHQVKYPADVRNARGRRGFTGFHYVYEPSKSSELQYWCEKR
jgi:hypothetical protein